MYRRSTPFYNGWMAKEWRSVCTAALASTDRFPGSGVLGQSVRPAINYGYPLLIRHLLRQFDPEWSCRGLSVRVN